MDPFREWLRRHFSDPQVVVLALLLVGGLAAILLLGDMLAPVIASLVIAYILESPVSVLERRGLPHIAAVALVFVGFLALILFAMLTLLPLLSQQLTQLVVSLPSMLTSVQELVVALPQRYPGLVDSDQVIELTSALRGQLLSLGQNLVAISFANIANVFTVGVYLFLVPLMVFFFLKDRDAIVAWVRRLLPRDRALAAGIWRDVDRKIGAYMRGKTYEILIVGSFSWIAFTLLGVDYAILLASLSGLSVLVPYVGVVAVGVPVGLVPLFQFGPGGEFAAVLGAYTAIQIVDGNVLAPLLISEVVDLHPIAVVVAILVFGGIWGLWGVFFAIPLATLATSVVAAWPRQQPPAEASPERAIP